MITSEFEVARERMVREQVFERGVHDRRVLKAMLTVPRHSFLSNAGAEAYTNHAYPIGCAQTMSQPYMVGYLSEQLQLTGWETVLEIGTGSGYHAAVLSQLAKKVYTVERVHELADRAFEVLRALRLDVDVAVGDGGEGWVEKGPFDRILLTAAASDVSEGLLAQLRDGGFMLGPVVTDDNGKQEIVRVRRSGTCINIERMEECSFVPLVRGVPETVRSSDPV